MIEQVQFLAVS